MVSHHTVVRYLLKCYTTAIFKSTKHKLNILSHFQSFPWPSFHCLSLFLLDLNKLKSKKLKFQNPIWITDEQLLLFRIGLWEKVLSYKTNTANVLQVTKFHTGIIQKGRGILSRVPHWYHSKVMFRSLKLCMSFSTWNKHWFK